MKLSRGTKGTMGRERGDKEGRRVWEQIMLNVRYMLYENLKNYIELTLVEVFLCVNIFA